MKRIITAFLCCALLLPLWGIAVAAENAQQYIQPAQAFAGGSGTENDPFQIETAQQLALLAKVTNQEYDWEHQDEQDLYRNGYYVLTADIVLNETTNFANWETEAPAYVWEPIGTRRNDGGYWDFEGVFDGQGHTISGLYSHSALLHDKENNAGGLFGRADRAQIRNVNITDSMLIVNSEKQVAGLLASDCRNSVIENCHVSGLVILDDVYYGGGVIGNISGKESSIKSCSFSGELRVENISGNVGGVCGFLSCEGEDLQNNASIAIENCPNGSCGGVVGNVSDCALLNSRNSASITAAGEVRAVGGICAILSAGSDLTRDESGELIGVGVGAQISGCTNSGEVTGKSADAVGGITGEIFSSDRRAEEITIQNCTNTGTVTGAEAVGGIAGEIYLKYNQYRLLNCVNSGSVIGDSMVAGIIGTIDSCKGQSTIENCENQGDVTAQSSAGGILGWGMNYNLGFQEGDSSVLTISKCRNSGTVTIEHNAAGGIVGSFMHPGGDVLLELTQCENAGTIHSNDVGRLGGILGGSYAGYVIGSPEGPACHIRSCVNSGVLSYGDASVNAEQYWENESGEDGRSLNSTEKAVVMLGGSAAGGIVGSTFRVVVQDCLSRGRIHLHSGCVPVGGYAFFSEKTDEDNIVFVGGICGLTTINDEDAQNAFEMEHYTNCAYTGNFPSAVCAMFLSEDSAAIAGNRQITEQEAEAMAMELLK